MFKKPEEVAVLVQARLSSERCPKKMIRPFAESNLVDICLKKLKTSKVFSEKNIVLAVSEPELVKIGEENEVRVFHRSDHSAAWDGGPDAHLTGMYEWWDKIPFKYVVLINACTPLLTIESIDRFFVDYCNSDSSGAFAVMEKMNYFWDENFNLLTPLRDAAMNTKNVQTTYEAAHCLYASRLDSIEKNIWMGDFNVPGDITLVPIDEKECYDIDYEWQFPIVESIYKSVFGK
tara:strand:+ start:303 stop:1001 length:699 start_codon:yes stop_codon:yes gene_type:complete